MVSLHQLRCFCATVDHGSFTRAAESLGLAQPSVAEQLRALEASLGQPLFHRLGRGVAPTVAGQAFEVHARAALDAVEQGRHSVAATDETMTGTIRLGLFGAAHLYLGSALVADVRARYPAARLSLVGQNSTATVEQVRTGRLEAALVVLPVDDGLLDVTPVARDEIVHVTAHPDRARAAVTPADLAALPLVLSEATWGDDDYTRQQLRRAVQSIGATLRPTIEVENVETALEVAAAGLADAVTARGVVRRQQDRLAPLHLSPLEPRLFDHFAVVRRHGAVLSAPVAAVLEMAVARLRRVVSGEGSGA